MPTYTRRTRIRAPLSAVWSFHSRVEGLEAVTPSFMNLRVEAVEGPDGEADPEILHEGTRLHLSIRPFGVGERRAWTSVIEERVEEDHRAWFVDRMAEGPFPHWVHTHRFVADGEETLVEDRVEYRLPGGPLGRLAEPFGDLGFAPMFRERHRRTKQRLE